MSRETIHLKSRQLDPKYTRRERKKARASHQPRYCHGPALEQISSARAKEPNHSGPSLKILRVEGDVNPKRIRVGFQVALSD